MTQTVTDTSAQDTANESSSTDASAPSTVDLLDALLSKPPLSLSFDRVSTDATTQTIGPAGGSIESVASDGTTFVLAIPEGALFSDVDITMTPIANPVLVAVGDTSLVGVVLEPEGLRFVGAAELEITGPGVAADSVGFAADGDGAEFHVSPAEATGGSATMAITHFSTFGIAEAELADLQEEHGVSSVGQAAQAAVGADNRQVAVIALAGWAEAIRQLIENASGTPSLEVATSDMFAWLVAADRASARPWWTEDDMRANLDAAVALITAWRAAVQADVDRLTELCRGGLADAGFRISRWWAIGTALSSRVQGPLPELDAWRDAAENCLTFVLTWEPTVTVSDAAGRAITSARATSGPLAITRFQVSPDVSLASASLAGQPVEVTRIDAPFMPCGFDIEPGRATMGLTAIITNPNLGGLDEVSIEGIYATVGIDEPVTITCAGQDFGFHFFSAEADILNIPRNNSNGYSEFVLEIVRDGTTFARTSTTDTETVGSTSTLDQTLVVTTAGAG